MENADFLTIRQAAKAGLLTEHRLRLLHAQSRLPGIQVGNRFLINVPLFRKQLDNESRHSVMRKPNSEP